MAANNSNRQQTDIAIIGGGLCGLGLATTLAKQGWQVVLLEKKAPPPSPTAGDHDGRALVLNHGTQHWLNQHDLWPTDQTATQAIQQVHISAQKHFGVVKLTAKAHGLAGFGSIIPANQLQYHLWQQANQQPGVQCIHQAHVKQIKKNLSVDITYHVDGLPHHLQATLCIAADGSDSICAQQLNISAKQLPCDKAALIAKVDTALPHQGCAYQRFLGNCTLAFLPHASQSQGGTLVWTLPIADMAEWQQADTAELQQRAQNDLGFRLGQLTLQPRQFAYPVRAQLLNQLIKDQVIFIGNAAQTLPPIAAQGFNLGVRDVAALSQQLSTLNTEHQRLNETAWQDAYRAARTQDRQQTLKASQQLLTAFSNQCATPLRCLGLTALSLSPLGQGQLIKAAAQVAPKTKLATAPTHLPSQSAPPSVTIVGAGISGLSLAAQLCQADIAVNLIDRKAPPTSAGDSTHQQVSAISPTNWAFLQGLGINLASNTFAPYRNMHIWDQRSDGILTFDTHASFEPHLGVIVSNQALSHALWQILLQHPRFQAYAPAQCQAIEKNTDSITLRLDQQSITSNALIGADGKHSWVRQQVGIECTIKDHGQTALVASVQLKHHHQHTAWQHFISTGPVAILPLADPQQGVLVWSADTAKATELLALDEEAFVAALNQTLAPNLSVTHLLTPQLHFKLIAQHADRYTAPRIALIGDAAHTIHPLAGQGLNLSLRDTQTLGQLLIQAADRQQDLGAPRLLRHYQRQRHGANAHMQQFMFELQEVYAEQSKLTNQLRGKGMNLIQHLPLAKQWLIIQATG